MIWFINGRYLNSAKARIPVNDLSVLRGYGVFDFLVTYNKKPFHLGEHINRLYDSAEKINLTIPYSKDQLFSFVLKTIDKNQGKSLTVRIVVTGGVSSTNIFPENKSNVIILVSKRQPYPNSYYLKGIKLKTYDYKRFYPKAKHINYLTAVITKIKATKQGYLEILYTNNKKVLECTTSNIFIIKNETLITPKNDILIGITRNVVLDLARKFMKVKESTIKLHELFMADEAFITASDKEIMPVVQINRQLINRSIVGQNTKKIMQTYKNLVNHIK